MPDPLDPLVPRHLGLRSDEIDAMLAQIEATSIEALIDETIPASNAAAPAELRAQAAQLQFRLY